MRLYNNLLGHSLKDPNLNLNKHGHRCKDLDNINFHNYLLFAGDNVALDFNLPIEKTYPYLVSQNLKIDYYNIAVFNGGIDAFKFNVLSWFKHIPHKPKALIISFEFLNSIVTCSGAFENFNVADYSDERVSQVLTTGEKCGFLPGRHILAKNSLSKLISVPIYQIEFMNKTPLFDNHIINLKQDGEIFDHQAITTLVTTSYKKQTLRQLP